MRVKIVKTPKRKKSRKLSGEETEYNQPTSRFEHFTKGPSLKFMDPSQLSNEHVPSPTTTAMPTSTVATTRTTAASTTATATTTTTPTAEISRRSGIYNLSEMRLL